MATTAEDTARAKLVEELTIPYFFAKVAADTGVSPPTGEAANRLRVYADQVRAGVDNYIQKKASAQVQQLVAAADAAAQLLGTKQAAAPAQLTKIDDLLTAPGVRDAVDVLLKSANAGCAGMPTETEEEEDATDKAPTAPVTA